MTSTERTVSVVIVSWNASRLLDACLESIFNAEIDGRLEVIVVDNDSSDGSPDMVEAKYPQVRLVRNGANLGFAAANNIGIRVASGEYVFLINSDVSVERSCMKTLVLYMDEHPKTGISGPTMLNPAGCIGRSCRGFPTVWRMTCHALGLDRLAPRSPLFSGYTMRFWEQDTTREVDILGGWFLCVRRSALETVGLLDERFFFYAEDMDWCRRFRLHGWQVMFVASARSTHHGGGSSQAAPLKYFIQQQRADLQLWRKHNDRWSCRMYYLMCIVHQGVRFASNSLLAIMARRPGEHASKARRSAHCLWWYLTGARD